MINRTLVRTKVVQTIFAGNYNEDMTQLRAKQNLLATFADTYSLYMLFFDFMNEMVREADERIAHDIERAKVRHEAYTPNLHFVNNRLATQVFNNRQLRTYLEENKLCWDAAHEQLRMLWKQIQEADCYQTYMKLDAPTYEDDKVVWRKIVTDVLADNDILADALEELEVALDKKDWVTDTNVVLSYVVKTIKRFDEKAAADQRMLEMFDSEEELEFAKRLLLLAFNNKKEYDAQIEAHLRNWDLNRIAKIDIAILQVALAEILGFPNIALEISINEYVEIAKEYSSEKSFQFVNGILEEIAKDLKEQNKLIKAVVIE